MVLYDGLTKAEVLVALYNYAKFVNFETYMKADLRDMAIETAEDIVAKARKFTTLNGRILNIDLSGDAGFNENLFDKFNGIGRAQELVDRYIAQKIKTVMPQV